MMNICQVFILTRNVLEDLEVWNDCIAMLRKKASTR